MATRVITNASVNIDTTDYSGETTKVAISYSAQAVDQTAMGDGTKKQAGGIKDWSMSFEFNAPESFFAKVGQTVAVKVRADSAVISTTNPSWEGTGLITEYGIIDAGVGDNHKVSLTVVAAGPLTENTTGV